MIGQATALVWRVELALPDFPESWVVGFRVHGAASLFVGQDPVYHFNASGQLRRAFEQGRLIKAEAGQLISMTRLRTAEAVQMRRETWDPDDCRACLHRVEHYLDNLGRALRGSAIGVVAQVPQDADLLGRVADWLQSLTRPLTIASTPHVGAE